MHISILYYRLISNVQKLFICHPMTLIITSFRCFLRINTFIFTTTCEALVQMWSAQKTVVSETATNLGCLTWKTISVLYSEGTFICFNRNFHKDQFLFDCFLLGPQNERWLKALVKHLMYIFVQHFTGILSIRENPVPAEGVPILLWNLLSFCAVSHLMYC